MATNGEIIHTHKGVDVVDIATGEIDTILMPVWKLEALGYDVTPGVPVRVEVESRQIR